MSDEEIKPPTEEVPAPAPEAPAPVVEEPEEEPELLVQYSKAIIVGLWEQGLSMDAILAALKLQGITKRSGADLSKKFVKAKVKAFIADGSIKKRPVKEKKPGA